MTVRRRVVVLTVTCVVFVGLIIGVMVAGLWMSDHMARRVAGIHGRLDVLSQLSAKASNYGKQAAEVMLAGGDKSDDLDAARSLEAELRQRRTIGSLHDAQGRVTIRICVRPDFRGVAQ